MADERESMEEMFKLAGGGLYLDAQLLNREFRKKFSPPEPEKVPPKAYYRLAALDDPEERLEDAALWKAMHDVFGDEIEALPWDAAAPKDVFMFGRGRSFEADGKLLIDDRMQYWTDPAFLATCGRSFKLCDWDEAKVEVARLHSEEKAAFVKSTKLKKWPNFRIPVGTDFVTHMDDWVYTFMDSGRELMVQELVPMRYERRFVVLDRKVVTYSPVSNMLTPITRIRDIEAQHFEKPTDRSPSFHSVPLAQQMFDFAQDVAEKMQTPHAIIDLACVCDEIVTIEFNPARIGQFGLFACDVHAIATAVEQLLSQHQ